MNKLQKFFQDGYNEQVKTAGDTITIINPKTKETSTCSAVLTENNGDTTAEIGDVLYTVSAHILIPQSITVKVGFVVKCQNFEYKVISCVKSPYEPFYSVQLIKI